MTATSHNTSPDRACWSGVLAMTLCVFALVASEFMPVSLLTPLAHDLQVSEGLAGQGIAISGALAVLTSLSASRLTASLDRKSVLLGFTVLMAISGMVITFAPNYSVYMVGRGLIGIVIGGFWSMSAACAMRLVPRHQVPRALAIFNGGNALATVISAPMGSFLAGMIGWRGAFFCLVPVALLALVWQWASLPAMKATSTQNNDAHHSALGLLKNPLVLTGMAACGLFFMGQFALFTYLRPFLENVTHVSLPVLSTLLLVLGVTGFIGTLLIGSALKQGFYPTLLSIPLCMALIAVLLIGFGHHLWLVALFLGLWGLLATSAPVGWWTWVAHTLPENAEAGGGLMVAIVQLSIATGSTLGGLAFDHAGWQSTFALSGVLLILAASLTGYTARKAQQTGGYHPASPVIK
ncbi:MFS transporter [Mangrovibacter phragmitis]|uniref:MFS transporter n=1 Tax=Mangrovibacter phragmitis TaxID=1691903 RepID=UPI003514424B